TSTSVALPPMSVSLQYAVWAPEDAQPGVRAGSDGLSQRAGQCYSETVDDLECHIDRRLRTLTPPLHARSRQASCTKNAKPRRIGSAGHAAEGHDRRRCHVDRPDCPHQCLLPQLRDPRISDAAIHGRYSRRGNPLLGWLAWLPSEPDHGKPQDRTSWPKTRR